MVSWTNGYGGGERLDNEDGCVPIPRACANGYESQSIAQARCDVDDADHGSVYAHAP